MDRTPKRVLFNGRTSASQADDVGSIPITRSIPSIVDDASGNNVPEVAIRSVRNSDGRNLVEIKNTHGPTQSNTLWFSAGHTAHGMTAVADGDGNTVPEVALLARRDSDGSILVEAKNAAGATAPMQKRFSDGFSPLPEFYFLDDVDGNSVPEASVMLYRTTDGRIAIQRRNITGTSNTADTWTSPEP